MPKTGVKRPTEAVAAFTNIAKTINRCIVIRWGGLVAHPHRPTRQHRNGAVKLELELSFDPLGRPIDGQVDGPVPQAPPQSPPSTVKSMAVPSVDPPRSPPSMIKSMVVPSVGSGHWSG